MEEATRLRHLALAERHIAEARERIVEQEARVAELGRDGHATGSAEHLLRIFRESLEVLLRVRQTIIAEERLTKG